MGRTVEVLTEAADGAPPEVRVTEQEFDGTWTNPGRAYRVPGGGIQYFSPTPSYFARVP